MNTRTSKSLDNVLDIDAKQNPLLPLLKTKDYGQLALVNKRGYHLFKTFPPDVVCFDRLSPGVLEHRLVYHVAFVPDEKKAATILESNLNLLNSKFKKIVFPLYAVTDVTLLQLVQGAGDIEMRDRVLMPLFIKHYGEEKGIEEMQKQIDQMKNVHKPFDFGPIIEAISKESFNHGRDGKGRSILSPITLEAIETFRKDFDDNQPKIIEKAMQFRWETLQELNHAYGAAAQRWNHDYQKCALLEDVVHVWVLRYAMQNDKQRFNQGLKGLQKTKPDIFQRLQTNHGKHSFDYSSSEASIEFALTGSYVDIAFGCRNPGRTGLTRFLKPFSPQLGECTVFVERKLRACKTISQHAKNETSTCVMC